MANSFCNGWGFEEVWLDQVAGVAKGKGAVQRAAGNGAVQRRRVNRIIGLIADRDGQTMTARAAILPALSWSAIPLLPVTAVKILLGDGRKVYGDTEREKAESRREWAATAAPIYAEITADA